MGTTVCGTGGCRTENLWINSCRHIDCILVEITCTFARMSNSTIFKSIYFLPDMSFKNPQIMTPNELVIAVDSNFK